MRRESSQSKKQTTHRALLKQRIGEAGMGRLLPVAAANTTFDDLQKLITADYAKNDRRSADSLTIVLARLADSFVA